MRHFFAKLKEKPLLRPLIGVIAAALLVSVTAVSFALTRGGTLSWFSENRKTGAAGMQVSARSDFLRFEDLITVEPAVGNSAFETLYFRRAQDGGYYQIVKVPAGETAADPAGSVGGEDYTFAADAAGARVPFSLTGLFPGETLLVTVRFRAYGEQAVPYSLSLSDFDDSAGRFTIGEGENNTPGTYSVLGIFRAEWVSLSAEQNAAPEYRKGAHSGSFFASFDTKNGCSVKTADPFEIVSGTAAPSDGVISCSFRVSLDLGDAAKGTQYYSLRGTVTNMLSKKRFSVGALSLSSTKEGEG